MSDAAAAPRDDARRWEDACLAAALFALDPVGCGGVALRSAPGPVRDRWLALLATLLGSSRRLRRVPCNVTDERLLGGLDLAATLQAGRPVMARGILADADQGVLVLAMAERLTPAAAARYTAALDAGEVVLERDGFATRTPSRFGLVALDEGIEPDEQPPPALLERLAFWLDLNDIAVAAATDVAADAARNLDAARDRLAAVGAGDDILTALGATAAAFGITSVRAVSLALRAARAAAALRARDAANEADATQAAQLVFAPRATRLPAATEEAAPEASPPDAGTPSSGSPPESAPPDADPTRTPPADAAAEDRLLAATQAALPADLLGLLQRGERSAGRRTPGRAGASLYSFIRGRPVGAVPGEPVGGARLHVLDTLRAAAPWQRARAQPAAAGRRRVEVRRGDLRVTRFRQRTRTTSVFLVDASGSTALNRLGEAKGAVELLLADCYVRRDRVALIAFRKLGAELLLPPTRSLVRARRALAGLPGGGGTPLAHGIDAACELVAGIRRQGESAVIVVLTDGRANIARDGRPGREAAEADALKAAQRLRGEAVRALLLDTAPQASARAARLASAMGARYVALPRADAAAIAGAARLAAASGAAGGAGRGS